MHALGLSDQISSGESSLRCSEPTKTCQDDWCRKVTAESSSSWETAAERASQTTEGTAAYYFLQSDMVGLIDV